MAVVLALSLVLPIATQTSSAFACSCEPPNLQTQFEAATVAFSGEVESVSQADSGAVRIEFEADEFWKGQPTERVTVYTAPNSAACGSNFEEDTEYFVLVYGTDRLETNLCQFNVNLDDGRDADIEAIESLGEGQEPDDDDPPSQGNGDDPPGDGDEPTDDGDGNGGGNDDGGTAGDGDNPGAEGDTASDVDPEPVNVAATALAGLVAAGAVVFAAGRK